MDQRAERPGRVLGPLLRIADAIDWVSERIGRTLMWLVLASTLVSAGNAVVRKGFSTGSNAWLEIQWYMFAAMFMLAAGYTLKHDEHVRVDLLYHRYPPRVQAWVDLLGNALFLIPMTVIIGWLSWPMVANSYAIHEMSNDPGGLVRWPVKAMIPLGCALLLLQAIAELIKRVAQLAGKRAFGTTYQAPLQ